MNRLTYFILPLLLLLAGPAGAVDDLSVHTLVQGGYTDCTVKPCQVLTPPRCAVVDNRSKKEIPIRCHEKLETAQHDIGKAIVRLAQGDGIMNCWDQMEAAMRAMEPYVEWFTGLSGPDINFDDKQQIRLLAKTYQQWKAAKACWRTP